MKSTPAAPTPPDPVATAAAQTLSNQQTAQYQQGLNLIDQNTPLGSLTYSEISPGGDGTPPHYSANTTLTPEAQNSLNLQQQTANALDNLALSGTAQVGKAFGTPLDYSNLPTPTADTADLNKDVQSLYAQQTLQLDPQFDTQQKQLETQLVNKGIPQGSDAWNKALQQFNLSKSTAYNQAWNSAQTGGQQFEANQFNMDLAARQQGVSEADYLNTLPINEVSALMSGGQVSMPGFSSTPQTSVANTNTAGITQNTFQDQESNYQSALQANSSGIGAVFGAAGSILGGWASTGFA